MNKLITEAMSIISRLSQLQFAFTLNVLYPFLKLNLSGYIATMKHTKIKKGRILAK